MWPREPHLTCWDLHAQQFTLGDHGSRSLLEPGFQLLQGRVLFISADVSRLLCPAGTRLSKEGKGLGLRVAAGVTPPLQRAVGAQELCTDPLGVLLDGSEWKHLSVFDTHPGVWPPEEFSILRRPCQHHHRSKLGEKENREQDALPPDAAR